MATVKILKAPVKSEGDKKEYRQIELPNGLRTLLISSPVDSEDGKEVLAAANLTCGVGSFSETRGIGGLAHFLEHMLFLGCEKFPEESGYNNFIAAHGGQSNAITENEFTTYFFEVAENVFPEALDRFAQQFIAPSLRKEALQREREVVDSEFQEAVSQDELRLASFYKMLVNKNHPASFFDYGNLSTLKDGVSDDELHSAIRELFQQYVANNMYLSLQSKRSLDELQQLAFDKFSAIKYGEVAKLEYQKVEEIFKPEFFNKIYFVKPKKDSKKLYLTWYLNSVDPHYKCRPLYYLEAIFNNEGEGGLSSFLREKHLAVVSSVSAESQVFDANSMFALLKIKVQLTDLGLDCIEKVLEAIFTYLLMLKETPIEEHRRLYNELKEKSEMEFKFHKESDPSDNVVLGSWGMKYFEEQDVLRGHTVFQEFCEEVISKIIADINERKFNLIVLSKHHESFPKREKFFGVEYDDRDFPESYQKIWDERQANPNFFLQKPNPFKASNFEIFVNEEESPDHPVKIHETSVFEVWHKLDKKFGTPRGEVRLKLISPKHLTSAYNHTLLQLFRGILRLTLKKKVHPASSAGLSLKKIVSFKGLELQFSGFSEKIHLLIDLVTSELKRVAEDADETIFEIQRNEMKKNYRNELLSSDTLASDYFSKVLKNEHWTKFEYFQALDSITFEDLQKFAQKLFRQIKVQLLVQGNITKSRAMDIVAIVEKNFEFEELDKDFPLQARAFELPQGTNLIRLKSLLVGDDNSCLMNFYQVGPETVSLVCKLRLLESILHPKAFEILRTEQQLGYSVEVTLNSPGRVVGLCIQVSSQEQKHNFTHVLEQMNQFINEAALKIVESLTDEEMEDFKDARTKMLTAGKLELEHEVELNWNEIETFRYMFDRSELAAKVTKGITKSDLLDILRLTVQPDSMRKLSVQVIGNKPSETSLSIDEPFEVKFINKKLFDEENLITNIEQFQSQLTLHPLTPPII